MNDDCSIYCPTKYNCSSESQSLNPSHPELQSKLNNTIINNIYNSDSINIHLEHCVYKYNTIDDILEFVYQYTDDSVFDNTIHIIDFII